MKGMRKIKRGKGFAGVAKYALGKCDGVVIGGNMTGETAEELGKEFGMSRMVRKDIEKPVWHNSLRLPAGETLSDEKWAEIADDYMTRMGFSDSHQRAYILHDEQSGQHIHIIASRVSLLGNVYIGENENLKSTQHIMKLEHEYGLTITRGTELEEPHGLAPNEIKRANLKVGEIRKHERTGEIPIRYKITELIDEALADRPSASLLVERLSVAGVNVRTSLNSAGINGFSFEMDGVAFKGSQLGKSYTAKGLLGRGMTYEQNRDNSKLSEINAAIGNSESREGPGNGVQRGEFNDLAQPDNQIRIGADGRGNESQRRDADNGNFRGSAADGGRERIGVLDQSENAKTSSTKTGPTETRESIKVEGKNAADPAREAVVSDVVVNRGGGSQPAADGGRGSISGGTDVEAQKGISTGDPAVDKLINKKYAQWTEEERKSMAATQKMFSDIANNEKKANDFGDAIVKYFTSAKSVVDGIKDDLKNTNIQASISRMIDKSTVPLVGDIGPKSVEKGWVSEKLSAIRNYIYQEFRKYPEEKAILDGLVTKVASSGVKPWRAVEAFSEVEYQGDIQRVIAEAYSGNNPARAAALVEELKQVVETNKQVEIITKNARLEAEKAEERAALNRLEVERARVARREAESRHKTDKTPEPT